DAVPSRAGAVDPDPIAGVCIGRRCAVGRQADPAPFDDVVRVTRVVEDLDRDAIYAADVLMAADDQATQRRRTARDPDQCVCAGGAGAVDEDLQGGVAADGQSVRNGPALGVAVDGDWVVDRGQAGVQGDRVQARAGDVELDLVRATAVDVGVGVGDR